MSLFIVINFAIGLRTIIPPTLWSWGSGVTPWGTLASPHKLMSTGSPELLSPQDFTLVGYVQYGHMNSIGLMDCDLQSSA